MSPYYSNKKIAEEDIDRVYGISAQHDFEDQQNGQHKKYSKCIIQLK